MPARALSTCASRWLLLSKWRGEGGGSAQATCGPVIVRVKNRSGSLALEAAAVVAYARGRRGGGHGWCVSQHHFPHNSLCSSHGVVVAVIVLVPATVSVVVRVTVCVCCGLATTSQNLPPSSPPHPSSWC